MMPSATVIHQYGGAFVVRLEWRPRGDSKDQQRFQVLATRDDKVYEMRGYRTLPEATRAAKVRAKR